MGICVANGPSRVGGGRRQYPFSTEKTISAVEKGQSTGSNSKQSFQEESIIIENICCQMCTKLFNNEDRPPVILCNNQHNACRRCVSSFYSNKIKSCPFCSQALLIKYDQDLLERLDRYQGASQKQLQMRNIIESGDNLLTFTQKQAEMHNYKNVLEKLSKAETNPVDKIEEIQQKLSNISTPINLSIFVSLTKLQIIYAQLPTLGCFGCLPNLRRLNLGSNKIKKIKPIYNYYNLEYLNLQFNDIGKIENLQVLNKLKQLHLAYNNIHTIEGLEQLTKLQSLTLTKNKLKKIQNLDKCKQLRTLKLDYNEIRQISGLDELTNLEELNLNSNQIKIITNLENLKRLRRLHLASNRIVTIENMDNLTSMTFLDIKNNPTFMKENTAAFTDLKKNHRVQILLV